MQRIAVEFGGGSNPIGGTAGEARFVNCFLKAIGAEGKETTLVQAQDGLTQVATHASAQGTRGIFPIDDANLLWVAGVNCFHVDASFSVTSLGGIPGTGPVTFAKNRKKPDPQVMIAGDGHRYLVEKQSGSWAINRIEDSDLLATHSCAFVDGYFLAFYNDGRFGWSSLDEGSEWAALDRAVAEGDPDPLVRGFVHDRTVYLLGEKSLETWRNTGSSTTFERTGFREIGCKAGFSVQAVTDGILWVSDDDRVRLGHELTYRVVSNAGLELLLENTNGDELRSWTYAKAGEEFYVLACNTWCWELNVKTGRWNERESLIDGEISRWRGEHYARWGNRDIFGNDVSTPLYEASEGVYNEAGTNFTVTVQTPPQHTFPNGALFHSLHVDLVSGVGLNSTTASESNPELMLQWSDDGGQSWSNELRRPVGKIGERSASVRFDRLGRTGRQGRVWKFSWSAPVARQLLSAYADVQVIGE